jgi:hypothetical protein
MSKAAKAGTIRRKRLVPAMCQHGTRSCHKRNLTLRKLAKGERAAGYTLLVAGHVLVTLRETFAAAPGINAARVLALRDDGTDTSALRPGPVAGARADTSPRARTLARCASRVGLS